MMYNELCEYKDMEGNITYDGDEYYYYYYYYYYYCTI